MDPVPTLTSHISNIHLLIMLTTKPRFIKWLLPTRFSKNMLVLNSHFHHIHHPLQYHHCPSHDQHNNVQLTPHIMELCTVQVLQPPDTSYTLSSNGFLNSIPSNTTNPLCSPLPILHPTIYTSLSGTHIQFSLYFLHYVKFITVIQKYLWCQTFGGN